MVTSKKESKWLSDLETLKAHYNAFIRDKDGFLCYDTPESAKGYMRVDYENSCRYVDEENEKIRKENKSKESYEIMSRRGQIERFWKMHPFYYDESKIFWLWDKENYKWKISDEVNFCNSIFEALHIDTIDGKTESEIVRGFKQVGRKHKPKEIKKTWVQFKDKIYDIKTDECFNATPDYFVTNPIPWKVGDSEETPIIDKLFNDWIEGQDKSWKDTLYQIIAYNISSDKFMQRIIAFVGGGSNGKGTYIKLNYKFLGEENYVASEIKNLSEDKFEPAVLFNKLLCVMGEVSYGDLRNTNMLKKLGGEDKISFQFKQKTPFTEENTATCICLTNSMPITPDKTQGFYRKWLIIDFLNQFTEIDKNLIEEIPDVEFENLAKKSLRILKELYDNPHFVNEGTFNERAIRYEERSNPIIKFIETECEEIAGVMMTLRDFTNSCNEYLKKKHLRILNSNQIGKIIRNEGFIVGNRKIDDIPAVVIVNLRLKVIETTITIKEQISLPCEESNAEPNSNGILNNQNEPFQKFEKPQEPHIKFSDKEIEDSGINPDLIKTTISEIEKEKSEPKTQPQTQESQSEVANLLSSDLIPESPQEETREEKEKTEKEEFLKYMEY